MGLKETRSRHRPADPRSIDLDTIACGRINSKTERIKGHQLPVQQKGVTRVKNMNHKEYFLKECFL